MTTIRLKWTWLSWMFELLCFLIANYARDEPNYTEYWENHSKNPQARSHIWAFWRSEKECGRFWYSKTSNREPSNGGTYSWYGTRFQLRNNFLLGTKNLVPNPFNVLTFTVLHISCLYMYNHARLIVTFRSVVTWRMNLVLQFGVSLAVSVVMTSVKSNDCASCGHGAELSL